MGRESVPGPLCKMMSRSRIPVIFSTCKLQVKRVHYWDEIHGNREEYIHGRRCDKGYDGGFPGKTDTGIFIPMLCGLLFQQLYNMADTIIVGKCLGVKALAAVGSTGSINFMIIGFCLGGVQPFSITVAPEIRGKEREKALRAVCRPTARGWQSCFQRS